MLENQTFQRIAKFIMANFYEMNKVKFLKNLKKIQNLKISLNKSI